MPFEVCVQGQRQSMAESVNSTEERSRNSKSLLCDSIINVSIVCQRTMCTVDGSIVLVELYMLILLNKIM